MSSAVFRTPHSRILVHDLWWTDGDAPLGEEMADSMRPYVTRYGQTLGITVLAVGGADDHLHVLYDAPSGKTPDEITAELQRATTRYVRETLGLRRFAWAEASAVFSVAPQDATEMTEYITNNAARHRENRIYPEHEGAGFDADENADNDENEIPAWLRDAL
jgi:REP element-mobilizing transposase RayT